MSLFFKWWFPVSLLPAKKPAYTSAWLGLSPLRQDFEEALRRVKEYPVFYFGTTLFFIHNIYLYLTFAYCVLHLPRKFEIFNKAFPCCLWSHREFHLSLSTISPRYGMMPTIHLVNKLGVPWRRFEWETSWILGYADFETWNMTLKNCAISLFFQMERCHCLHHLHFSVRVRHVLQHVWNA